jgi:hypothetical protein
MKDAACYSYIHRSYEPNFQLNDEYKSMYAAHFSHKQSTKRQPDAVLPATPLPLKQKPMV